MGDGWEDRFGGSAVGQATLLGYHRSFNKKSTTNWGTTENPAPTLGLEPADAATCIGILFDLPDGRRDDVLAYLRKREGKSFEFPTLEVRLEDGSLVHALTPVNDRTERTYLGALTLDERVRMARTASGSKGSGIDYVRGVRETLHRLGIRDPAVEAFSNSVDVR